MALFGRDSYCDRKEMAAWFYSSMMNSRRKGERRSMWHFVGLLSAAQLPIVREPASPQSEFSFLGILVPRNLLACLCFFLLPWPWRNITKLCDVKELTFLNMLAGGRCTNLTQHAGTKLCSRLPCGSLHILSSIVLLGPYKTMTLSFTRQNPSS